MWPKLRIGGASAGYEWNGRKISHRLVDEAVDIGRLATGFDPVNAQLITKEILELKDKGCTVIFSTHRMETVEDLCDHIALINKSKKILEGSKKQVKETYRNNTFWVEHRGTFPGIAGKFEVLEQKSLEDDYYRSVVKSEGTSPNILIRELTNTTEVHSFIEKIPTMSEIFISLVKGGSDE